jgi:hypothetical protein
MLLHITGGGAAGCSGWGWNKLLLLLLLQDDASGLACLQQPPWAWHVFLLSECCRALLQSYSLRQFHSWQSIRSCLMCMWFCCAAAVAVAAAVVLPRCPPRGPCPGHPARGGSSLQTLPGVAALHHTGHGGREVQASPVGQLAAWA